jgi:hypothetical protein
VLVRLPEAALEQVDAMMTAVCDGDYEEAAGYMYGNPDLGMDRAPADPVGVLIWDAFAGSLSWELSGGCYATDSGLSQNVVVHSLDLNSITENLGERSQALLAQRVEEAEDLSQVYDENNEYLESFVMGVLYEAVEAAIAEDASYTDNKITLNLVFRNDAWWVMPEQPLMSAISGGIAG